MNLKYMINISSQLIVVKEIFDILFHITLSSLSFFICYLISILFLIFNLCITPLFFGFVFSVIIFFVKFSTILHSIHGFLAIVSDYIFNTFSKLIFNSLLVVITYKLILISIVY